MERDSFVIEITEIGECVIGFMNYPLDLHLEHELL